MARFTKKKEPAVKSVTNHMGAESFSQPAKEELAFAVLTTFAEDSYYESKDKRLDRIRELVKQVGTKDPLFVAKLAIVTRREFHMRSAFHILAGELMKVHNGDAIVRNMIYEGAERPDDLVEIISYVGGKPLPMALRHGIKMALTKFDEYQFSKYKLGRREWSMTDVFNTVRPNPKAVGREELYHKVVYGELETANTFQTRLSAGEVKEDVWQDQVMSGKIGYMALVKNLRNIATSDVGEEVIDRACQILSDPIRVQKSKLLPFEFLKAYNALSEIAEPTAKTFEWEKQEEKTPWKRAKKLRQALDAALKASVVNLPDLPGKTLILVDNSGSMRGDRGGKSVVSAASATKTSDIGNLFAAMYRAKTENAIIGVFGDRFIIPPDLSREDDLFTIFSKVEREANVVGPSTEAGIFDCFRKLIKDGEMVDRIVIFSDSQIGDGNQWYGHTDGGGSFNELFQKYRKMNPDVRTYSVDLRGYGNTVIRNGVVLVAGWSEKIFKIMSIIEKGQGGFVKWISDYAVDLETPRKVLPAQEGKQNGKVQ